MDPTIRALLRARRRAAGLREDGPPWGLALSGGGIRSATFCFGLLSALARGLGLGRFDLLSTVSGGGYIGAFLGRLYSRLPSSRQAWTVERAMADPGRLAFARWLRANGRYLLPRGAADRTLAAALYLRNLVAVHLELGLLALLLGALLVGTNVALWLGLVALGLAGHDGLFTLLALLPGWAPTLVWVLLPVLVVAGLVLAMAYWTLSWMQRPRQVGGVLQGTRRWALAFAAGCGLSAALLAAQWDALVLPASPLNLALRQVLASTGVVLLASAALAAVLDVLWFWPRPWRGRKTPQQVAQRVEAARTQLTQWLALCLKAALLLGGLGLLDKLAWHLAFMPTHLAGQGAALGLAAVLARAVVPLASGLTPTRGLSRLLVPLAQLAGYALSLGVAAWWMSLVYRVTMGALWGSSALDITAAARVLGMMAAVCGGYLLLTAGNADFLNASSLHRFYRARLARSYLGASNAARLGMPPLSPMNAQVQGVAVGEVHADDDVRLGGYRPHLKGGPVHLINVCVNETRNPVGGLFNRDRRGRLMTLAGGGFAGVMGQGWRQLKPRHADTLATWVAVSGAAVAPAMGRISRGGLSALLAFAGLRLGYWWNGPQPPCPDGWLARLKASKTGLLLRETLSMYLGLDERRWLLTDGGHFENTGAYALLAAQCELIVLADCGADPDYRFGDLENLVRMARIDLGVDVVSLRPYPSAAAAQCPPAWRAALGAFGSLDELVTPSSSACLGLARIHYADGQRGVLVLVKPNLSAGLPVDLVNFKAANPGFPQQSTADQFFGEAQWESYFRLGQALGEPLSAGFLAWLVQHVDAHFEPDCPKTEAGEPPRANLRLPARLSAAALGAGALGLGAMLTLAVSLWQGIDALRSQGAAQTALRNDALGDLAAQWSRTLARPHEPPDAVALGTLAARVIHHAEMLCPGQAQGWYQESATAQRVARETVAACQRLAPLTRPAPCNQLLDLTHPPPVDAAPANCLATLTHMPCPGPRYGLYDYGPDANPQDAPPTSPLGQRRAQALASADSTDAPPVAYAPGCARPLHPLRLR